jgi:outer membrane protein assembly factor BamB
MKTFSFGTRLIAAFITVAVFAAMLIAIGLNGKDRREEAKDRDKGSTSRVATEPWPLFGGTLSRNMVNLKEKNICSDWTIDKKPEKNKNVLWVQKLGSKAYGGPTFGDGKIFIGTNNEGPRNPDITGDKGVVMCFDQKTGEFLWQSVHDKLAAGLVNDWPQEGICSAPVVEGKRIYYVSNRCELICATTEGLKHGNEGVKDEKYHSDTDADIVWRLDMIGKLGVFPHNLSTCSPLVVGDTVFTITSNGVDEGHINVPKPQAPSFLAVDKRTGTVKWQSNLPSAGIEPYKGSGSGDESLFKRLVDAGKLIMHGQWSNPVYAEPKSGKPQIIFPGGNGWIYAFNPDNGDLIWKFDCNPKSATYELGSKGTRSDFVSTPVVHNDKLYIGVGQDPEHEGGVGHFWCIDITKEPRNKDKDLSPADDDFDPKSPKNKDSGLVWHYGGIRKNPGEGESQYIFGRTLSTPSIHDGLCYVGELDGILHCLDAETGKQYWDHQMDGFTWSSAYWVDGKVYMGNDAKQILIFEHGKEKKLLNTINMREKVRATPVAVDGVLYVMTETKLYAIKEK